MGDPIKQAIFWCAGFSNTYHSTLPQAKPRCRRKLKGEVGRKRGNLRTETPSKRVPRAPHECRVELAWNARPPCSCFSLPFSSPALKPGSGFRIASHYTQLRLRHDSSHSPRHEHCTKINLWNIMASNLPAATPLISRPRPPGRVSRRSSAITLDSPDSPRAVPADMPPPYRSFDLDLDASLSEDTDLSGSPDVSQVDASWMQGLSSDELSRMLLKAEFIIQRRQRGTTPLDNKQ